MSRPSERFGIGSLAAYDELVAPGMEQARRRGAIDYLEGLRPQSVQQPNAAMDLAAAQLPRVPTLEEEFQTRRDTYRGILGDPAEQRNLTQAQMLFDIANTALAFSTAGSRPGMSPAERLAEAAVETKLFPTISARAQAQQEQQQKFDLAALQSAEASVTAQQKAVADLQAKLAGQKPEDRRVVMPDGTQRVFNIASTFGYRAYENAIREGGQPFTVSAQPAPQASNFKLLMDSSGNQVGSYDLTNQAERRAFDEARAANPDLQLANVPPAPALERPIGERDYFNKFGMTEAQFNALPQVNKDYLLGLPVVTPKDFFNKFGMTQEQFSQLAPENRQYLQGLPTLTDKEYMSKFGMPKEEFLALDTEVRNRLTGVTPEPEIRTDALGRLVDVTNPDDIKVVWNVTDPTRKKLQTITIDGVPQTVDINSKDGEALLDRANQLNQEAPGRATITNVTGAPTPKSYVITNTEGKTDFVTSYDNGATYSRNGQVMQMPDGAYPVSDTIANEVAKSINVSRKAGEQLVDLDADIAARLGNANFTQEDITSVTDALEMARQGTGLYSNFVAAMDALVGAVPVPAARRWLSEFTKDNQQARQYLRGVTVLARSALVVNPRFPVAEMQKVEQLFVRPESLMANPESEANKFIELKSLAMQQYRRNLQQLEGGVPKAQREQIQANNFELQRLMSLLPGVPLPGEKAGAEDAAVEEASRFLFPQQ